MKGYIKTMRSLVGHRTVIQCGASVILVRDGEILLQKRADDGNWGYHGGSVDIDEVIEEAAKRELFEETGLIAEKLELFGVFSGPEMHYVYPNGDEVSNVDIVYICRDYSGEMHRQETEVTELKFFSLDEIPENIFPPNRMPLKAFIKSELRKK